MPELPEVETVRRTLMQLVVGKQIDHVTINLPRIIKRPIEPEQFADAIVGQTIQTIERRGKFLKIMMDELMLVSHLRMEGKYGVYDKSDPLEPHTHVIFHFTDGTELRYRDVRQFGTMHLFLPAEESLLPPLNKLGVEPLDEQFTVQVLREKLERRSSKIKPLLLNQEHVVGLGNIYVDEALFKARIHPEREASTLTEAEWSMLFISIKETLQQAVEMGGSSIKSYVNGQGEMGMFQQQLLVYGRKSEPCPTCDHPIEKLKVAGRGTHICTKCQQKL
ncbi:DNA-formamidopyrimidine glycosylase [Paenibacillus yanchengensis]|uniref:Formamidopyrimidine-DNA glycosylase n=1 Tax=Paenibacillus yanchengensis TaxID=2035833 RepID=A0ABW4YR20_9BACL